jgi:hypothetical protein
LAKQRLHNSCITVPKEGCLELKWGTPPNVNAQEMRATEAPQPPAREQSRTRGPTIKDLKRDPEPVRGSRTKGANPPAFRVGPTVGPLSVSDRSKGYLVLPKVPRKLLTLRSLQICQGSGVGSIPIGRSNILKNLRYRLIFHIFQNYNFVANLG